MKILITGNAGAGKSTLAAAVAAQTGSPCIGLDRVVWQPQWKKTPTAERTRREAAISNEDAWIVDGISMLLLKAADTVVSLDMPRCLCFWRVFWRNLP